VVVEGRCRREEEEDVEQRNGNCQAQSLIALLNTRKPR
jgi:hypothetical protein